jgi:hypothetical protein
MTERLPKPTVPQYSKIGLQIKDNLYEAMKLAAFKEDRHLRDILNDAVVMYMDKKHPTIHEEIKKLGK